MIVADHSFLHTAWQVGVSASLLAGVVGFIWGSARKGRAEAEERTLRIQAERIDVLEDKVRDLTEEVHKLRTENAQLQGENNTLRSVLTGETVPAAQIEAMRTVASDSVKVIEELLHPVLMGIERLLTKGDEEQ